MKYCPNLECPGRSSGRSVPEYRDDIEQCGECGTELSSEPPPEPPAEAAQEGVVVQDYFDTESAHLAAAALQAAGIPAYVDDRAPSVLPHLAAARTEVRVVVPQRDADRARDILVEGASSELESVPESGFPLDPGERCPACGSDDIESRRFAFPEGLAARIGLGVALVLLVFVGRLGGLLTLLVVLFVYNWIFGLAWRCRACGQTWRARSRPAGG